MNIRNYPRLLLFALLTLILVSVAFAAADANTVSPSMAGVTSVPVDPNVVKPAACNALTLTAILVCPGGGADCRGTTASELIIGSPQAEKIRGGGGTDCMLGGDGDDDLFGNGSGDICLGQGGNDSFHQCETQIQ